MNNVELYNNKTHRYIYHVRKEDGWIEINGRIGRRRFLYYTLKDATTVYNKIAKEKLQ